MMCFQQCQNESAGLEDQSACHGKEQVPVSVEMQVQLNTHQFQVTKMKMELPM